MESRAEYRDRGWIVCLALVCSFRFCTTFLKSGINKSKNYSTDKAYTAKDANQCSPA